MYRSDNEFGEYFCIFEPQVIEKIVYKFMKDKNNASVNINHTDGTSGIYLIESFLMRDNLRLNLPEFEDVENGSWMTSYKVDNPEVWKKIQAGNLNGYSIEISGTLAKTNKALSSYPFTREQLREIYQTINFLIRNE
ncbi:MAG: XkdF-like putative serine protease domain-containing protein [Bacteroides sp.]|nr:XkdF-like putative serine protease domain-containing protein [Bacteroides sp.]